MKVFHKQKHNMLTSHNSDLTTFESWDGGGHTTENSSNHTVWYEDSSNPDNLPKSYSFGIEKSELDDMAQYKGSLYNWLVATAGSGTNIVTRINLQSSICPYGWKLPIATEDSSFDKSWLKMLMNAGSDADASNWSTATRTVPYSLVRVGNYAGDAGSLNDIYSGIWWSASGYDAIDALYLHITSDYVSYRPHNRKGWGFSIRCISR